MRKSVIEPKYAELLEGLAELNQLKTVVKDAFKREFQVLKLFGSDSDSEEVIGREAFIFNNVITGDSERYAFRKMTVKDLRDLTYWHKNSQYCWLLMSAYEKFEIFLESSYCEATDEPPKRDLNQMLYYFSDNYQSIKAGERHKELEINLRIAVHLVEKMRHRIAHEQGKVPDTTKFIQKVISDSGVNNNKKQHEAFISQFILEGRINILEVVTGERTGVTRYHDQFQMLVNHLILYAYLVKEAAQN